MKYLILSLLFIVACNHGQVKKNPEILGFLDVLDQDGVAAGWALATNEVPNPIRIDFYSDDKNNFIGSTMANEPRQDLDKATGYPGINYGFHFQLPQIVHDGKDHQLFAYGASATMKQVLNGSPKSFNYPAPPPPVKKRNGIVHADGRQIVDDDGSFYPLGATVMWALHGYKFERDRLIQNLKFLKDHHYDYIRILGEVGWPGNDIDPAWPDYSEQLAGLIDTAYDEFGLRVEITIIGGGHEDQAVSLTQKIINVVAAGRTQKILDFEVANESYGRRISLEDMRNIGRMLRQAFPSNLVAISSAEGVSSYKNSGDYIADFKDVFMRPDAANLGTVHMARDLGDDGWRADRQPWDWKDLPFPMSHNEPIGPRSSVAQEVDPVRLAMLRATGIINGVPAFVLHNGAGVAGQVDPGHDRPANLWEVPNIDAIMDAVRGIDKFLPTGAGTLNHWNNGWAGAPWNADAFWSGGGDHGVNRNYSAASSDGWISVENGVKNYAVFTANSHCLVEVYDVLVGKVQEAELQAGQTLRLEPVSRDNFGYGAFIIIGHYR